jgi:hypothetical protein
MLIMARKEGHVVSNPQGGRDVEESHAGDKAWVQKDACKNHDAKCVVHDKDGKIQKSHNYGSDPLPPRDGDTWWVQRAGCSDSKGGWIVTRRGYVVPLDKGKEGIHKKFDEILSTNPD